MNWLYYLLEANLYLVIFYGFYRLFLHRETFYGLNRSYLIFSSIVAFLLPFFQLGFLKAPVIEQITAAPTPEMVVSPVIVTENLPLESYQSSIFTIDNAIIAIYSLVTIVFLLKMLFNLSKIISMRKLPSVKLDNGVKLIDLKGSKIAFSFFKLLFLDPDLSEKNTILKHELVHIKQKHSLDVLLFEIIQIINWFNPIVYLVKKDIKLIHEYLADEETTKYDVEKYHYAMFLIQNSTGIQNLTLTNQIFSSSILKKRINMLNQKKSARWARLKLLLVLPVTAGILCISTMAFTKDYGFVDLMPEDLSGKISPLDSTIVREILTKSELVATNLNPMPNSTDNVHIEANTKDMFAVYLHNTKTGQSLMELDWSLIPNGTNIKEGYCYKGTKEFSKIDSAINMAIRLKKTLATVKYGDLRKIELKDNQKLKSQLIMQDKGILPPPAISKTYFPPYKRDGKYNYVSLEKRVVIINGKEIADKNKFYGAADATEIKFLKTKEATEKYGKTKGQFGAVEITGKNVVFCLQPPIVKKDQIKLPPSVDSQTSFYPKNEYSSKTQKAVMIDQRYIVINGKPITDNSTFYGVRNTNSVKYLNQLAATKKYGQEKGKNGAVEITGDNLMYLAKVSPPPLPVERDTTKKKKIQKVIIKGYKKAMEVKTVEGYPIQTKDQTTSLKAAPQSDKSLKEVTIKALEVKKVQGYPIKQKDKTIDIKPAPKSDKNLKEVTIKAYEKAMDAKSDGEIKEIRIKESPTKVDEKKGSRMVLEIHQDEIIKSKNDKLNVSIPEGAAAELTIYNSTYDKAFYQTTNYKNDWYAKELPNGKYPYNFVFRKNGKVVGGKSGFVEIK
ncbi:hypothetical protein OC25_20935 [Pedobacter kyungheensis]|uniref:Peptidase M56 domain-containing protein n=1 Tax=Pedobacter kyungheensis TaxID=1069985 RepID=A0A0C1DC30_9SPHI|nr:M56 family metallopeptidase [Pedobacter kyungheensis]KIA91520.1 hypothetical protein OC25_20935 [Pedobacter kyungheensis]